MAQTLERIETEPQSPVGVQGNRVQGKISLVLPAHNEEPNIRTVVEEAAQVLPRAFTDYEIVVVNDGSKDRTLEIAQELERENSHVRVVNHPVNRGYGAALTSGFNATTGDFVMFMDSDRQFDINDIHLLTPYTEDYDIVAGYRIKRNDPAHRLLNAKIFGTAVKILFDIQVRDIDCAFKIMRAEVLRGINLESPGALINTEILAKAKVQGCNLTQVGVNHYPRVAGEQSGASVKVVLRAFWEMVRLWWRMKSYVPPSGVVVERPPTWRGYALFGGGALIGLTFLRGLVRLFKR
ncbi:MAG TPA: glycosyltransferase family 2 protein [Chloroflexia bacterium]|nr:glycosyltransferase family 2 protein [Chloroflexia bacterium]